MAVSRRWMRGCLPFLVAPALLVTPVAATAQPPGDYVDRTTSVPRAPAAAAGTTQPAPLGGAPAAETPPPPAPPAPPTVPETGTGELIAVGRDRPSTNDAGREVRYRVEVERGLPVPTAGFAAVVHQILTDARGWQTLDGVRLVQVAGDEADLTVTLASPATTDALCAPLRTRGEVSCWNGQRAVLNAKRWILGADTYPADVVGYRRYLVSHEVGHGLGHGHRRCPAPGLPAPVMVQQTKSLEGCVANPWPADG